MFVIALAGTTLLLPGRTSASRRGKLESEREADTLSSRQLGLLVGDYANTFADTVKLSDDRIESQSLGLRARRAALQWKIKAVPTVFTVASHDEPLLSLADLWVLAIPQRDLFARDDRADILGQGQAIAQAASWLLEEQIESVARQTLKSPTGLAKLETFVRKFAAEHPIADLSFIRASLTPVYIQFVSEQSNPRREFAAVRGYADTALALALAGLNNAPEIARWQAELTLLDAETYPVVSRAVGSIEALGAIAVELQTIALDLPVTIDEQRDAILRDVERRRVDTLRDIELMRRALFIDLGLEREALPAGPEQQIQSLLDAVRSEREVLTGQLPAVAERAGEAVLPLTREVIDHAFWRAVQLLVLLAVILVATILSARMTRKRDRQ